MDIKQLEAFVNVVKYKSFSLAAKELFLTQPTISSHISSLEKELGIKLIVRTTRQVSPTKAGQIFYKYALEMLEVRKNALEALNNFEVSKEGEIVITSSTIPYSFFLPKIIKAYMVKNPKAEFKISRKNSLIAFKDVEEMTSDIGFTGAVFQSSKCSFTPFNEDKLIFIAPNTLYYRTKFSDGYSIQRLLKEPFICRQKGSGTRKEAEYLLKEAGIDLQNINVTAELNDDKSIIEAVAKGGGVAVVSSISCERSALRPKIITFPFENITRSRKFYIVKHKLNPLSPLAEDFYNFAVNFYKSYDKFLY